MSYKQLQGGEHMHKIKTLPLILAFSFALPVGAVEAQTNNSILINGESVAVEVSGAVTQGDSYSFSDTVTFALNRPVGEFNRYNLVYSSSLPLKGQIELVSGSESYSEDFFLEAGTGMRFSSLTDRYLKGDTCEEILSLSFSVIDSGACLFSLSAINTEKWAVLAENTSYIETPRYKMGINLAWGGGISYIEDKTDRNDTITNLLNNFDTGRLVQQSYYGTSNEPYTQGSFMGNIWPYNPVQGGDRYNNPSKLIDFRISENEIYVKSRPLDWGHRNLPTYAYLENTYRIDGELIRVDNWVVDFSDYINPITDQELPAFYTISYLNNFYFYNGDNPWSNAPVTKMDDLGFWAEDRRGYINFNSTNTETWAAWADDSGWGIGLYVPGVTKLWSGRYEYDGSKDPSDGSTNYVAPVKQLALNFAEKISYSYLITTGEIDDIRDTFSKNRDFTSNPGLEQNLEDKIHYTDIDFSKRESLLLFYRQQECTLTRTNESAVLKGKNLTSNDPFIYLNLLGGKLSADRYKYLVVTYSVPQSNSQTEYTSEIFLGCGGMQDAEGGKSVLMQVKADGQKHSEIIELGRLTYWTGNINFLRLDFFTSCSENDSMNLYAVSFAETAGEAEQAAQKYLDHIKPGDIDGDGEATTRDALLALQAAVGKIAFTENQIKSADVDGKKGVSSGDALLILQYAVGKIDSFPKLPAAR